MRRRSKNNPWRNTWQEKTRKRTDVKKLAGLLLLVTIPLMCIGLIFGSIVRTPDLYQYNFTSSQALEKSRKFVDQEQTIALFKDFMQGRTDEFVLLETVAYEPENLFSEEDDVAMHQFRRYANAVLVIGAASLAITLVIYVLLLRWRRREFLRRIVPGAGVLLAALLILQILAKTVPGLRALLYGRIITVTFPKDDFLIYLAKEGFGLQLGIFEIIGSLLIYGILLYVTFRLTSQKTLFRSGGEVEYQKMHQPIDRI